MSEGIIFAFGLLATAMCTAAIVILIRAAMLDGKPPS
jgi:hypothetical protein